MAWNTLPLAIKARLQMVSAITHKVGQRVHYQMIPQTSTYPHIWFTRTTVETEDELGGNGPAIDRYDLEIVSESFDAGLVDAVVATLQAIDGPFANGTVFLTEVDDADDEYQYKSADSDALFLHALTIAIYHDNEF